MRISTTQLFDAPTGRMTSLTAQADKLQAQIATGTRITKPSDDVPGWQRLVGLDRDAADDTAYGTNVKLAQGLLAQTDTTLGSVQSDLQRAQEIAVNAGNGAMSAENLKALGTELSSIIDDLMNLANTRDVRGQYVFGGADGGTPFTQASDGSIGYAGTGEPAQIPIADGSAVSSGMTGDKAFGTMFATLQSLRDALMAGNPAPAGNSDALKAVSEGVDTARASVGARAIRTDLESDRLTDAAAVRADTRQGIDSIDVSSAITELQKTLTILQATQASFTKLANLSLFDYLS